MGKNAEQKFPRLQETRLHGTVTFPCTMYIADADSEPEGTPFEVKLHWHENIELLHFEKGKYRVGINMDRYVVEQEAFSFVNAGKLHTIDCGVGYQEQAVLFDPMILSGVGVDAASKELIDPLVQGRLRLPEIITERDPGFEPIKQEFDRIRRAFQETAKIHEDQRFVITPASQLRIKAALMNILASLYEAGQLPYEDSLPDPRIEALKKVMTYVRENYASKIYIRELADIMNMNEQYFCRFFKKTLGKTPVTYMNEVRIRQAVLMLEKTQETVVDIANACGYGNMGHFITEFKRLTGHTPLEYRRVSRQEGQPVKDGGLGLE